MRLSRKRIEFLIALGSIFRYWKEFGTKDVNIIVNCQVYLLQHLGVPLHYHFKWYGYPYCSELADEDIVETLIRVKMNKHEVDTSTIEEYDDAIGKILVHKIITDIDGLNYATEIRKLASYFHICRIFPMRIGFGKLPIDEVKANIISNMYENPITPEEGDEIYERLKGWGLIG